MSLYLSIAINNETIHTFGAQNISGKTSGVNAYRVCRYVRNPKHGGVFRREYLSGTLSHKYEDGAIVLAKKVLDFVMVLEQDPPKTGKVS